MTKLQLSLLINAAIIKTSDALADMKETGDKWGWTNTERAVYNRKSDQVAKLIDLDNKVTSGATHVEFGRTRLAELTR